MNFGRSRGPPPGQDLKTPRAPWAEPLLEPGPGRARASRRLLPTPWLLNEPLSAWSLLVLAARSPWNRAQVPGKANRDCSFEEKMSEAWKGGPSERRSSTRSLEKPPG